MDTEVSDAKFASIFRGEVKLKMETECSSKPFISTYNATRCYSPEARNPNRLDRRKLEAVDHIAMEMMYTTG
jgi:hypothetical protein